MRSRRVTPLLVVALGATALFLMPPSHIAVNSSKESVHTSLNQGVIPRLAPTTPDLSTSEPVRQALPMRLKIPSINVNAAFQYVGLTPDGAMGVPKGRSDVAWFNLGPRPGEQGSAVIAGHRGRPGAPPTVFDNLNQLHNGDLIYVQDSSGKTITFLVREHRIYDSNASAPEVFDSASGAHLNLITCDGTWNKSAKSFTERLVVFADLQN